MRFIYPMLIAIFVGFAPQSMAQDTTLNFQLSSDGWTIEQALAQIEALGLSGQVSDSANSIATVEFEGQTFTIDGYHCNAIKQCTEFLFFIGFDLPNGISLTKINEWNATAIVGRAYIDDEQDPWLDHIISVSDNNDDSAFREGFELWIAGLTRFNEFISSFWSS